MFAVSWSGQRLLIAGLLFSSLFSVSATCSNCTNYTAGVSNGAITFSALTEASGVAASRLNYGVLWTHNDGSQGKIYALTTNAARLATFNISRNVDDLEDIAVGPGPTNGVSYLYVGDMGGAAETNDVRSEIKVIRIPEPQVDLDWASNPRSLDFDDEDTFTLAYPDGSYDAETLMVDPLTADIWVATKQTNSTRLYRANVNAATNRQTLTLEFIRTVAFSLPSAGDISPDGSLIVLRREDAAQLWQRCDGEPLGTSLSRKGYTVPVIGPPTEPNGEGIAFLADNTGYVTLSEGEEPTLFLFPATCPRAPHLMVQPVSQSVLAGGTVQFRVAAAGNPAPAYQWRFNGQVVENQTGDTLVLSDVTSANTGLYEVTATNASGSVTTSATLTVRAKPDLRITEVMSTAASGSGVSTADWWELTNFEPQPVDLQGWRFNDNGGGLTDPFTINTTLVIAPGESIVFVEALNPAQFTAWWGTTNLPANLKIISYSGNGLSLGASGDGIRLWGNTGTDVNDTVASVDFGTSTAGSSFTYNPVTQQFGTLSQIGVFGAFRAAGATDIGSPGRIRMPVVAPLLSGVISNNVFRISFATVTGGRYSLQSRSDFAQSSWTPTGDTLAATNTATASFTKPRATANRFYRVMVE